MWNYSRCRIVSRIKIVIHLLAREFEGNEKLFQFVSIRLFRKKIRINYSNRYCIKLYWIASRIKICGNERVLAKEATVSNSLDILKIPFTDLSEEKKMSASQTQFVK